MKKTIIILLLTALCMAVFASCDFSGGLVGELLGELNHEEEHVAYTEDYYIEIETDIFIDIDQPTEIVTTPPYEITTEVSTTQPETDCDCGSCGDDVPVDPWPDVEYSADLQMDGDLSDWNDEICKPMQFGADNLEAWLGEVAPEDGFTLRMTADSYYVYFAIEAFDDDLVFSEDGSYSGDAFQIAIDYNGWCAAAQVFERAIFYSFGLQQDGTMDVTVQCIQTDAAAAVDYVMASDDAPEQREGEIIGVTRVNEDGTGWIAEYAISVETLYRDVAAKLEPEGAIVPEYENTEYIELQMLICYVDHSEDQGITAAYGTSFQNGTLLSGEGWYPENAGVTVKLYPTWGRGEIEYARN